MAGMGTTDKAVGVGHMEATVSVIYTSFDLYKRTYHKANKINQFGQASAICYKSPRPIPKKERFVMFINEGVNCPKCLKIISNEGQH